MVATEWHVEQAYASRYDHLLHTWMGKKKKKKKRETVNIRDNDGPPIKENLTHSWKFLGDNRSDAIKIYFQLSVIKHTDNWFYNNRHYMFNPLTPKIWLLILPPCCYTFPCKLVMRIWCSIMTKIQVLPDKFEFLITNLLDSAQMLKGEVSCWSLVGVKELRICWYSTDKIQKDFTKIQSTFHLSNSHQTW